MPRLSVDIDLTYVPVADREDLLRDIDAALRRIADRIRTSRPSVRVDKRTLQPEEVVNKLLVRDDRVQIKVEVFCRLRHWMTRDDSSN